MLTTTKKKKNLDFSQFQIRGAVCEILVLYNFCDKDIVFITLSSFFISLKAFDLTHIKLKIL